LLAAITQSKNAAAVGYCHDRAKSDHFLITQEFLSHMLGVRRASVGGCWYAPKAGLISYSRGRMTILNVMRASKPSLSVFSVSALVRVGKFG